jgi:hypothetical protein
MKLTPEELDVFKNLSQSELGAFLVAYLKKVQDHAYDSRTWGPGMSKEVADLTAKLLQEHVIDKIRPTSHQKSALNQHE